MNLLKKYWRWLAVAAIITVFLIMKLKPDSGRVTYQTTTVSRGTIVSSVSASGQILTSNLVNVTTQATGVVKAVYVKNGDSVFSGQKIAEITLDSDGELANAKAWQSLTSAQNAYRSTQASLANVYDQIKGHDTDETFSQIETRTKAEVANDNAYVALTVAGLSYRQTSPTIVAPSTGTIDNITLTPGMILTNSLGVTSISSNRVAVISFQGNPIATFNLSEVDVNRVKQGQKATITLDSLPGKTFTGKVMTVDKIGTVSSGVTNYAVIISFETSSPEILPNMAATANIIIETKNNALIVPSTAVQTNKDGAAYVRILRNGQPENVAIETGLSNDTQTEVASGLSEGDKVITGSSAAGTRAVSGSTSPFSTFRVVGGGGSLRVGR